MADKQPSFVERTKQMRESATALLRMAETVSDMGDFLHAEADHMAAAEKRFAEQKERRATGDQGERRTKRSEASK